ncbi:DUF2490 domain-containing protein [Schleiferia thermophila]|jgi:hypothetical protein|uniref:DUF2490 domain-containing protein n=1 Tax=Schleiferia thermophila TaxID=884107 RepID=UPI000A02C557|nr:DUF2490 domain-containing protein [Schleiferia thermophila]
MNVRFLFCSFSLVYLTLAEGQISKDIEHSPAIWGGYISSVRVSEKVSVWNDLHYVPNSFFIYRTGLSWHFTPQVTGTAGYAFLNTSPRTNGLLARSEHRPWMQLVFNFKIGARAVFNHRIRYDYRIRQVLRGGDILNDEWTVYHRLRFMSSLRFPLLGSQLGDYNPFFSINNEILFNFGDNIIWNYFDQNRSWLNIGYQFPGLTLQFGYMLRWVQGSVPGRITYYHTAVFWVTHALDVSKKKEKNMENELLHREP